MLASPSLLTTIVAFVLLLGPLIVIHELGHYLVGRWFGVKADAFSVGFGKEIAGFTDRRGTRWKLSALPLGGYVQFAGDMNAASMPDPAQDTMPPEERARTFQAKPLWQRSLIVLAGPLTNLLFAVAIFAAFNLAYGKVVATPEVGAFMPRSDAQAAGLKVGDRIVAVDGNRIDSATDIPQYIVPYPGRTVSLAVKRERRTLIVPVKLSPRVESDEFGNKARLADLGISFIVPIVDDFPAGSPARAAGIRVGDRVLAVDGRPVIGHPDILAAVTPRPGQVVPIEVRRDGQRLTIPVRLQSDIVRGSDGKEVRVGRLGIALRGGDIVPVGPVEAVALGFEQSLGTMKMMATGVGQIFTGERSVKELGGPIKIAKYSGEQFTLGWPQFVSFVALISINLAFINLLPIPALDGGHLAFYAAEAVRRKPLGLRSQEWAFRTGLALVLALMLFVTINDLAALPFFGG
ncbi:RIP metalloprotease RseP [Novosphingobium album (ex Liu et al. 2023)]|uniref:Zinc metalloprotease n=1 Tax=Novosphingobium album (ex Liu et al. 2023) TaxID=3031130 RepID=A0ABT5WPU0_9SPHN|nr:RIP metalloprotease RseP [Novosphingobium album (ex Liu et al. 2023)]MDE8652071.1 RIP metalloprotease RseP [Novosphingobium album (ex Liu et al. 2023)]